MNSKKNKTEKFWNRASKYYDKKVTIEYTEVIDKFRERLNKEDIILDYACATGLVSHEIAKDVKEVHGIDISPKMIAIAKQTAIENKIENINFTQTTIFDEQLQKESYQVIIAFNILHLVDDIQKTTERINELLAPGGLFISKTPSLQKKKSFIGVLQSFLRKTGIVPLINMPQIQELEDLITNANFKIIETENIPKAITSYFAISQKL